jgi:hypothetical protein
MQKYDIHQNHVETTRFEARLAECILEQPAIYRSVLQKINNSIRRVIEYNQNTPFFDRLLYVIFTELNQYFPGYSDINAICREDADVHAISDFHKRFFETLMPKANIPPRLVRNSLPLTLAELCQLKICDANVFSKLEQHTRPDQFFSPQNRGRHEHKRNQPIKTRKFGIASDDETEERFFNFFTQPYEAAQSQFSPNSKASIVQKMQEYDLPYISGASGTLGICFKEMIRLDTYTSHELKTYFMFLAARMIARGHHSFYEVMLVADLLGFKIKFCDERQQFYEQFLTIEFKATAAYEEFLAQESNQQYLTQYRRASCNFS